MTSPRALKALKASISTRSRAARAGLDSEVLQLRIQPPSVNHARQGIGMVRPTSRHLPPQPAHSSCAARGQIDKAAASRVRAGNAARPGRHRISTTPIGKVLARQGMSVHRRIVRISAATDKPVRTAAARNCRRTKASTKFSGRATRIKFCVVTAVDFAAMAPMVQPRQHRKIVALRWLLAISVRKKRCAINSTAADAPRTWTRTGFNAGCVTRKRFRRMPIAV